MQERYQEIIEFVVFFDAADMAALFDEVQRGIADHLLCSLYAVYEEVILSSGDEHNGKIVLLDGDQVFL